MLNDVISTVETTFDADFDIGGAWDRLLASSRVDTVFLSSGWLRAWRETLGADASLLIPKVRVGRELLAAAALQQRDGVIEFAGAGPSDYADFIVRADVDDTSAQAFVWTLIRSAVVRSAGCKLLRLSGVVIEDGATVAALRAGQPGFFVTELDRIAAPAVDLSTAGTFATKKSRQRERTLAKAGLVQVATFVRAEDIQPQLDEFFDQHVRRWSRPGLPSPFEDAAYRAFYRSVAAHLATSRTIRFTTMRLDGRLIAAHFGFRHGKRFFYYKPTFDPDLAKLSPGVVLLERILRLATDDRANEFDFLIGAEPYKYRFATHARTVVDLHITTSPIRAASKRTELWARSAVRRARQAMGTKQTRLADDE